MKDVLSYGKSYEAVRVAINPTRMNTNYLNSSVMDDLNSLSKRLGTPNPTSPGIGQSCGGGCEGLSTPLA